MIENYSKFVVETMDYIDIEIQALEAGSVDKQRLHFYMNLELVRRVKGLVILEKVEQEKVVKDIFKSQLNMEIHKCW